MGDSEIRCRFLTLQGVGALNPAAWFQGQLCVCLHTCAFLLTPPAGAVHQGGLVVVLAPAVNVAQALPPGFPSLRGSDPLALVVSAQQVLPRSGRFCTCLLRQPVSP